MSIYSNKVINPTAPNLYTPVQASFPASIACLRSTIMFIITLFKERNTFTYMHFNAVLLCLRKKKTHAGGLTEILLKYQTYSIGR